MPAPGFTAERSLLPTAGDYFGTAFPATSDDMVEPQFLGVVREIFQKAGKGLSGPIKDAASSIGDALGRLQSHGPNDPPFYCGSWAGPAMACTGNSPAYDAAEMLRRCVGANPSNSIYCASYSSALYGLVRDACRDNPGAVGELLPGFCKGQ